MRPKYGPASWTIHSWVLHHIAGGIDFVENIIPDYRCSEEVEFQWMIDRTPSISTRACAAPNGARLQEATLITYHAHGMDHGPSRPCYGTAIGYFGETGSRLSGRKSSLVESEQCTFSFTRWRLNSFHRWDDTLLRLVHVSPGRLKCGFHLESSTWFPEYAPEIRPMRSLNCRRKLIRIPPGKLQLSEM